MRRSVDVEDGVVLDCVIKDNEAGLTAVDSSKHVKTLNGAVLHVVGGQN